jgi:hypothetical protein
MFRSSIARAGWLMGLAAGISVVGAQTSARPVRKGSEMAVMITGSIANVAGCNGCEDLGRGAAIGVSLLRDFVVGGRIIRWGAGDRSMGAELATVEWYPLPLGRVNLFVTAGLGQGRAVVSHLTRMTADTSRVSGALAYANGAGADIRVVGRLAITPFFTVWRTRGGTSYGAHCAQLTGGTQLACTRSRSERIRLSEMGIAVGIR